MPTATDYSQAIQNLRVTVHDEELKAGEVAVDPMGLPLQYAGNFAVVFQVRCPQTQKSWAVKCFTKEVDRRAERYDAISQHLQQVKLPFMVGFEYQETGILLGGRWHPIVKMDWVEGETLNRFVAENLGKPRTLRQLLGLWRKLAERLRGAEVTHADLQHGNVLLVPAQDREGHRLMLVDYDGMYVPALARQPSGELGHPAYQHPERLRDGVYSAEVDRFSHLAIYCAIRCLMAGGRRLWERFDNGDNLLFRQSDFAKPSESEMLHRLWAARDEDLRALVGRLIHATQTPLDQVPWLHELVSDGQVRPLEPSAQQRVIRLMGDRYSASATSTDQQQPGVAGAVAANATDDAKPEQDLGFLDGMLADWAAQYQQQSEPDVTGPPLGGPPQTGPAAPQVPSLRMPHAKPGSAPPAHQVSGYSKLCSDLSAKAASGALPAGPAAPPSSDDVIIKEILNRRLPQLGLFVAPDVPAKKIANAMTSCLVPAGEEILGLIDCTVGGSAKNALVFGRRAAYYHNGWWGKSPGAGAAPYETFLSRHFRLEAEGNWISLDNNQFVDRTFCSVPGNIIVEILRAIRQEFENLRAMQQAVEEPASGTRPTGPAAPRSLESRIVEILRSHGGENGFYVSLNIPAHKALNAAKSCALRPDDTILGLIDCTWFGSASDALVFGKHGFYYHNMDGNEPDPGFVAYREFPGIIFGRMFLNCITLGAGRYCTRFRSRVSRDKIVEMLEAVKRAVIEYGDTPADDAPAKDDLGVIDDMLGEWSAQYQQKVKSDMTEKRCPACNREVVGGAHICPHCHTYIAGLNDF